METSTISASSENKIRSSLGRMVDMIDGGLTPTEALAKVAAEQDLPRGHLPIMARIYNVSASEHWRKTAADVTERAASFPLADSEAAEKILYPARVNTPEEIKKQSDISPDYSRKPVSSEELSRRQDLRKQAVQLAAGVAEKREKQAAAARPAPDAPEIVFKKAEDLQKQYATCRQQAAAAYDLMQAETKKTAERLLLGGATPVPLFHKLAAHQLGEYGDALVRHLRKLAAVDRLCRSQEQSCTGKPAVVYSGCRAMESATAAVAAGREYQKLSSERDRLQQQATAAKQVAYMPLLVKAHRGVIGFSQAGFGFADFNKQADKSKADDENHVGKSASLGFMSGVMGTTLGREISSKLPTAKPTSALVQDMMLDLTDPRHEQELRNARVGAMLNRLLADDEVIGSYNPQEVVQHYNDISQTAPRLAGNTELVRGFLRKRLQQGAFDPFDMDLMLKMENNLRKREAPEKPFSDVESVDAA